MIGNTGLAGKTRDKGRAATQGEVPRRQPCIMAGRLKQTKFPRPVRVLLWLGLPALLWAAIYFGIRLVW